MSGQSATAAADWEKDEAKRSLGGPGQDERPGSEIALAAHELADAGLVQLAANVKSGPTTHTNRPGHANFSKRFKNPKQTLTRRQIGQMQKQLRSAAASARTKSGPPTHTNRPGHANFTMKLRDARGKLSTGQIRQLRRRLDAPLAQQLKIKPRSLQRQGPGTGAMERGVSTHKNSDGHQNVGNHRNFTTSR